MSSERREVPVLQRLLPVALAYCDTCPRSVSQDGQNGERSKALSPEDEEMRVKNPFATNDALYYNRSIRSYQSPNIP